MRHYIFRGRIYSEDQIKGFATYYDGNGHPYIKIIIKGEEPHSEKCLNNEQFEYYKRTDFAEFKNLHEMKPGDILEASKKSPQEGKHPIIFLGEYHDPSFFVGTFLTHAKGYKDYENIPFEELDFIPGYKIKDGHSYFAPVLFLKREEWGPYYKVGKLTERGLSRVQEVTGGCEPISYDELKKRIEEESKNAK